MQVEVIAEIGCNHLGSLTHARQMIRDAKQAGADAVKFQFYSTDEIIEFEKANPPSLYTKELFDWIRKTELSIDQLEVLKECCDSHHMEFLCTPFINPERIELLNPLVKRWKLRERDCRVLKSNALLEAALETKKEILLSTAQTPLYYHSPGFWVYTPQIRWLYCIPKYPAAFEDLSLSQIIAYHGYSNHIPDLLAPLTTMILANAHGKERWTIEVHVRPKSFYRQVVPDEEVSLSFKQLHTLVSQIKVIQSCQV